MVIKGFDGDCMGMSQGLAPTFESLESRTLMSAAVAAEVVHGHLLIRITLRSGAEPGHIVVGQAGFAPGRFHVTGQDGTKINGQDDVILSAVTGDVRVWLGDGDILEMTDLAVAGNVVIRGNQGNDTIRLSGGSVGHNVTIDAGQGDNTTTIEGTAVRGRLGVSGGDGLDVFNLTGEASVAGKLIFQPGLGESTCQISHAVVGSVMVNGRGGLTNVHVDHAVVQRSTTVLSGPHDLPPDLLFGNRADVMLEYSTFQGNVRIAMGAGNDTMAIENSVFEGRTLLTTGRGDDSVRIQHRATSFLETDSDITTFIGSATVNLGQGDDRLVIGPGPSCRVNAEHILLNGGPGDDSITGETDTGSKMGFEHVVRQ